MTENAESLTERAISAAKWNYLGNIVKVVMQFIIGVWLARLLGPEAFGIVAIAWLLIGVGKLISDFGFSAALIQRADLTDRDIGYIFTIQVLIGFGLSLLGFMFASQIAAFFNQSSAETVIEVMAWLFVIQAIGQTTTAALNRALRFKFSQIANVATYIIGYVGIGLPMAYLGYGAWSLVAAQMTQAVSYTAVVLYKSGISIQPRLHPSKPGLFVFGGKVIGANICSYAILNLDNFIVGKYLDVIQLGVYNRAMTLLGTPNNVIVASLQSVLFSVASREQNNLESTKRSFLAATEFVALVCLPIFLTVAVVPEVVVLGIYGEAWSAAIQTLVPLALAMPVHAFLAVIGPVLMAINRTKLEVYAQLVTLLISAPLMIYAGMQSLNSLAWAVFITYLVRWMMLLIAARIGMCITLFEVSVALQRGLVLGLVVAGTVALVDYFLGVKSGVIYLLILMATASLSLLFFLRALGPYIGRGVLLKLLLERNALPRLARHWLRLN